MQAGSNPTDAVPATSGRWLPKQLLKSLAPGTSSHSCSGRSQQQHCSSSTAAAAIATGAAASSAIGCSKRGWWWPSVVDTSLSPSIYCSSCYDDHCCWHLQRPTREGEFTSVLQSSLQFSLFRSFHYCFQLLLLLLLLWPGLRDLPWR